MILCLVGENRPNYDALAFSFFFLSFMLVMCLFSGNGKGDCCLTDFSFPHSE